MKHKILKKYIPGILAASLVCTVCFPIKSFAKDSFSLNGSGTKADPYQISTADDLVQFAQKVKERRNISGKLLNDITVSHWNPIAPYHDSLDNAYTGVFDGDGKKITIQMTEDNNYQALFGYNAGTIENLTVAGNVNGSEYAAGIVAINRGIVENCVNEATVQSSDDVSFAGGITASNYGKIINSENKGDISSTGVGAVVGGIVGAMPEGNITKVRNLGNVSLNVDNNDELEYTEGCVGGIVGLNYKGKIEIAENIGTAENNDEKGYTGGISGLNNGSIKNSLNTGKVSGKHYVGGISGYLYKNEQGGNAEISNSLHHGIIETELEPESSGAIGGKNENGTALDNYYLEGSALVGFPGSEDGAIAKNESAFKSGEVAYLLNGQSAANSIWKQTIGGDSFPTFNAVDIVYPDFKPGTPDNGYTNTKPEHSSEDHDFDDKGACKVCGYESIRVSGHSLTLDGSIGANFYYNIDPMYYEEASPYTIEAEFTFNGKKRIVPFKKESVLQTEEKGQSFGFQINIDSDQMTFGIDAVLILKKEDQTLYRLPQETYRVYDYLLKVDEAEITNEKLKTLTKTLATYDFYSNEHFKYHAYYEPELSLLDVSDVNKELLEEYKWVTDEYTDEHTYRHYASTLQFKSKITLSLMTVPRDGQKDVGNIWLGYKKVNDPEEKFEYIEAKKTNNYYRANIENIPASELDETYEFYFFHRDEEGSYQVLTPKKTGSPYSYMYSMLASTTSTPSMKALVKSLYKYSQASKDYFASIGKE